VVAEDGGGLPGISVSLTPVASAQPVGPPNRPVRVETDGDGNFKFTGLSRRLYWVTPNETKGYVRKPMSFAEREKAWQCRAGDDVTITLIRGGVITGRVTTASGEPMVGVQVSAQLVKDSEGNTYQRGGASRIRLTDDRGVYRLYGLAPGTYVVFTRGRMTSIISPYDGFVTTFHPSSPRELAGQVEVGSGSEASGIDIRFRELRGRTVSGTVLGGGDPAGPNQAFISVPLYDAGSGMLSGSGFVRPGDEQNGFAILGVADGEYEIKASRSGPGVEVLTSSAPRRVTVKGADVGGIVLKLEPPASLYGKVVVEGTPNACESKDKSLFGEMVVSARSYEKDRDQTSYFRVTQRDGGLNEKGEFVIDNLEANRYFIVSRLPGDDWYVKSITAASATRGGAATSRSAPGADVARNGVTVNSGDKLTGLTLTISGGAASLSGRVDPATEGARLPARMRVHLVPAEATAADDVVRYAETLARREGSYVFNNLAPGRYWLIARAVPDDEPADKMTQPAALEANERLKLRREAALAKTEVELKACQRLSDQVVKYQK
jgi:hypothetical protein